jgi:hypothetical protein
MSTKDRKRHLERRITILEEELARLEEIDALLPKDDPFMDGDAISYVQTFSGQRYDYIALRVKARWYLTGTLPRRALPWSELRQMLAGEQTDQRSITVAIDWEPISEAIKKPARLD